MMQKVALKSKSFVVAQTMQISTASPSIQSPTTWPAPPTKEPSTFSRSDQMSPSPPHPISKLTKLEQSKVRIMVEEITIMKIRKQQLITHVVCCHS